MKKKLCCILSALIILSVFVGCAEHGINATEATDNNSESEITTVSSDDIIWFSNEAFDTSAPANIVTVQDEERMTSKPDYTKLTISSWSYKSELSDSAFEKAAALSGLGARFVQYFPEDVVLKILAGDSDVDIYVIYANTLHSLLENGMYVPIESDIIANFNAGCFDYISEVCKDENGATVAMPIGSYVGFITYPEQAAEEIGFTREDIAYVDAFQKLVMEYDGVRESFSSGSSLFSNYSIQYETYYCDYGNKQADFDTELYKHLYHYLDGWILENNPQPAPTGFTYGGIYHNSLQLLDAKKTMFSQSTNYKDFITAMNSDPYDVNKVEYDINDWRIAHIPWITEEVDKNDVNVYLAIVNPYSKNHEAAVKALEYIAENFYDSVDSTLNYYPFICKDKNQYPERYQMGTQIFSDMYDVAANGNLRLYDVPSFRNDIKEYQAGRLNMDEAIAMYQREVDIWLNE